MNLHDELKAIALLPTTMRDTMRREERAEPQDLEQDRDRWIEMEEDRLNDAYQYDIDIYRNWMEAESQGWEPDRPVMIDGVTYDQTYMLTMIGMDTYSVGAKQRFLAYCQHRAEVDAPANWGA